MSDKSINSHQLELFKTEGNRLNVSNTYETIPKSVLKNDPDIVWINETVSESIEKHFTFKGQSFFSEITPASFKDRKGIYRSHFPSFREDRVEYAIISLAEKSANIGRDKKDNPILFFKTTYYQIQKEIVDSINNDEGTTIPVKSCPYNSTEIKEALEILKRTDISVRDENRNKKYIFNRIKTVYIEEKNVVIELGDMMVDYINNGTWSTVDKNSILASKNPYEMKLKVLLNTNFRYAEKNKTFNPNLNTLIERISYIENKVKRITLFKIIKILENMHEVSKVEYEVIKEGRKIVDAKLKIFPSERFVSTMIINNKIDKSITEAVLDDNGEILIKPIRENFKSQSEFKKAFNEYNKKMYNNSKSRFENTFNIID